MASLKYEKVYLKAYETVAEARPEIGTWITFYNHERTHQSLDRQTPENVLQSANGVHLSLFYSHVHFDYYLLY
ncbi:MAG: transposase [Bacteroidetes bacterium]|nr:transposase [Bacteroidota bacterium]